MSPPLGLPEGTPPTTRATSPSPTADAPLGLPDTSPRRAPTDVPSSVAEDETVEESTSDDYARDYARDYASARISETEDAPPTPDVIVLPSVRVELGPLFTFAPRRPAALALEVGLGFQWLIEPVKHDVPIHIQTLLGYAYDGPGEYRRHAFHVGAGLGLGDETVRVMYRPRYLIGRENEALAHGVRHGLSLDVFLGTIGLEIAHDWRVTAADGPVNGLVTMVHFDLAPVVVLMALLGALRV